MEDVTETTTESKEKQEEELRNRRQFLNGLGKWSLAVIAAVSGLREGVHNWESAIGLRFGSGLEGTVDPRRQIAREPYAKYQYREKYYGKYGKYHGDHTDRTTHSDQALQ